MELTKKHCVPCENGAEPFGPEEIHVYLMDTPGWENVNDAKISRTFEFADFVSAMSFVDQVADIAEGEGHHPDIHIHYNKVTLELSTHASKGLTENDFIVAAKVNGLYGK